MEYDFSRLNDREFEALGASVIRKILGKNVETFKAGRDGGVDGRFWVGQNKEGIIQCKHYIETPYKSLISKLKSEEVAKVKKLNPEKYIFITSKKLSRLNKQEIRKIFYPFIKRDDDIFGREDLNDFLTRKENQDVVEQNIKLWITSVSVLDLIHNNAIKGRSESTIRDIEENSYKYAITENHKKGLKILEDNNVIIITGEPGIGKTTLADNLALYYTAKGYEFCDIEENISEAENLFREKEKKKILFYCDDFIGSNLYDAINNKRDSHVVKFINRVCKDDSKKFILTSRTTILNKAYSLSHSFQNGNIRNNEFLLKVENLTKVDKAYILYNHLFHSKLNRKYLDKIYEDKRYKGIINHRNFNPRIIEFVTDKKRVGHVISDDYWSYIKSNLENPKDIWADYFQNQTDDCVRALVFLTVFNNGRISEEDLSRSYNTFLKIHTVNLGDSTDKSFEAVRKLVTKSLLNRNQVKENKYEYVLFNPSITDFIHSSYLSESELISNIIKSLETETSLRSLNTISIFNKISEKCSKEVQENLFDYFYERKMKEEDWDYLILLSYIDFFNDNLNKQIEEFLNTLVNSNNSRGNNLYELLCLLSDFEPEIEIKVYRFLYGFINNSLYEDSLVALLDFIDKFNINDENVLSQIKNLIDSYLQDVTLNNDLKIDFDNHINQHSIHVNEHGGIDFDLDISGVESDISDTLDSFLENFNRNVLRKIEFCTLNLISSFDIDNLAIAYLESQEFLYDRKKGTNYNLETSHGDDIDAIFERL